MIWYPNCHLHSMSYSNSSTCPSVAAEHYNKKLMLNNQVKGVSYSSVTSSTWGIYIYHVHVCISS